VAPPPSAAYQTIPDVDDDFVTEDIYTSGGQVSPRTAEAIAASIGGIQQIPIGTRPSVRSRTPVTVTEINDDGEPITDLTHSQASVPIEIDDDDDDFGLLDDDIEIVATGPTSTSRTNSGMGMGMGMEDNYGRGSGPSPVRAHPIPSGSPWSSTRELMDRMASMMDSGLGMSSYGGSYSGSEQGEAGFRPDGSFTKMYLVGPQKMNFFGLLEQCCVLPHNWRLAFPSRAMMDASPLQSANSNFESIVADAKDTSSFIVVHLFDGHADSSDFYNMIIAKEEVQNAYAEGFITYYANVGPVERSAFAKILSPSTSRPFPITVPLVLIMATVGGKLWILDVADSKVNWAQYMDKLIITKETYAPQIFEDAILASERKNQTTIVDEQNSAFEMAQKADMERARKEEEERNRQAEEAHVAALEEASRIQHEADLALNAANAKSNLRSKYISAYQSLPAEPTAGRPTVVAIRLPDGSQARRKFDPEGSTLAQVFTFVAGAMAEKLTDETFHDPNDPSKPWNIDNFDLSAQFPARRFTHAQASQTLQQVGLKGQELLNLVDRT
jgi:hypothetical protein